MAQHEMILGHWTHRENTEASSVSRRARFAIIDLPGKIKPAIRVSLTCRNAACSRSRRFGAATVKEGIRRRGPIFGR